MPLPIVSPLSTGLGFVIMQIGDADLDRVYGTVIAPALEACGLAPTRVDKHNRGGLLKSEIIGLIRDADMIVADLTNERPNCYLEVGYAMGVNKFSELILTAREDHSPSRPSREPSAPRIHFDLAGYDILYWRPDALPEFRLELEKRIRRRRRRGIALDADDSRVIDLVRLAAEYEDVLYQHFDRFLTRSSLQQPLTAAAPRLARKLRTYPSWASGGDIVMGADIVSGHCQVVVCLVDPLSPYPHNPRTVLRACEANGIPALLSESSVRSWMDSLRQKTFLGASG